MKKYLIPAMAVAMLFMVSCKDKVKGLYVPTDAALAVHIDGASINSKLSWEDIKKTEWFKEEYAKETNEYKKKLMDDPEMSGINIKSDFVWFVQRAGKGAYSAFEGNLKDAAAFEKFNNEMAKDKKVEKDGDISFVRTDDNSVLTWNNSTFLIVQNDNSFAGGGDFPGRRMPDVIDTVRMNADTTLQRMPTPGDTTSVNDRMQTDEDFGPWMMEQPKLSADTLLVIAKSLMKLEGGKTLYEDDRFADLVKEKGEVHMWMNAEHYYPAEAGQMLSMTKMGDMLKGNISAVTINFDNGKVEALSKTYMNDQMEKIFKEHKPQPVNEDLINMIPSQNVMAVMALNMPSEGMNAFFKASGMEGFVNVMLSRFNLTLAEITNAYKGEMLFSLSIDTTGMHQMNGMDDFSPIQRFGPTYFAAIAIKNKPSFEKLLGLASEVLADTTKVKYRLTDQWFALSNSAGPLNEFQAGGSVKQPFADKISGHPFGAYVDLQKIMNSGMMFPPGAADSTFQDIVITGGEWKGDAMVTNFQLNLVDKSTNSLKQFFMFGSKWFKGMAEGEMDRRDEVILPRPHDSIQTTIPQ